MLSALKTEKQGMLHQQAKNIFTKVMAYDTEIHMWYY